MGIVYRTQESSEENNNKIVDVVKHIQELRGFIHILLMGDYNFPEIKGNELKVSGGEHSVDAKLFDATQDAHLFQHIIRPTRLRPGQEPSILDLVFSNEEFMVDNVTYLPPLGSSDHEPILWSFICYANAPANKRRNGSMNYPKDDYSAINESLSKIYWEGRFQGNSVNTNWNELMSEISKAVRENVPLRKMRPKKNQPPWWNKKLLRKVKRKYESYKRYKRSGVDREYELYKRYKRSGVDREYELYKLYKRSGVDREYELYKRYKRSGVDREYELYKRYKRSGVDREYELYKRYKRSG